MARSVLPDALLFSLALLQSLSLTRTFHQRLLLVGTAIIMHKFWPLWCESSCACPLSPTAPAARGGDCHMCSGTAQRSPVHPLPGAPGPGLGTASTGRRQALVRVLLVSGRLPGYSHAAWPARPGEASAPPAGLGFRLGRCAHRSALPALEAGVQAACFQV
jgi:hypothetical protein